VSDTFADRGDAPLEKGEYEKYKNEIMSLGYKGKIDHSDIYTRKDVVIEF